MTTDIRRGRTALARHGKLLAIAACLLAGTLSACASSHGSAPATSAAGTPKRGGDISVWADGDISSLDPVDVSIYFSSGGDRALSIYGSLMQYGRNGAVEPAMAQSMTSSDDDKVWTITLRPNVKFTDGTPYNAAAVVYNLDRQIAPDSISQGKGFLAGVTSIKATGNLTVTITLSSPDGSFANLFTPDTNLGYIASPTAIKKEGASFGHHPVGAGPFMLKSWTEDSQMVLTRNPGYWNAGQPYLNQITFQIVPDANTLEELLKNGQIQMAEILPPSSWGPLVSNPSIKVYTIGSQGAAALFPNLSSAAGGSLQLRQAIQLAFDPQAAVQIMDQGFLKWNGDHDCLPFAANSPSCAPGTYPAYNLAKAKSLVQSYLKAGHSPVVNVLTTSVQAVENDFVQQVLTQIGLKPTMNSVDIPAYNADIPEGDYDFIVFVRVPFNNPFPDLFSMLAQGSVNLIKQDNAQLQDALIAARDAATPAAQEAGWKQVLTILNKNADAFWMAPAGDYMVTASTLHMGPDYGGGEVFYPAEMWLS